MKACFEDAPRAERRSQRQLASRVNSEMALAMCYCMIAEADPGA